MGRNLVVLLIIFYFFTACSNNAGKTEYDSPSKGTIYISVDETFKPVIAEQIKVYESSYPEAHIVASYKSEADCFRDFRRDSTRMIIVSRPLTRDENDFYKDTLQYSPQSDVIAYDAIALIVNAAARDSAFTIKQLKSYLTGADTGKRVVVDGGNATSAVRLLLDSFLNKKAFGKNVFSADSSKGVVNYIADNTNAIGFVGSSWVGNDEDPEQAAYLNKVHFGLIECRNCEKNTFAKPSQATISAVQYPLVRPLYFVLKENSSGLGSGFAGFMKTERGQLIFRRSLLVPGRIDFILRDSQINNQ